MTAEDTQPRPTREPEPFEEWDFEALSSERARSSEYDERRLRTRRKLLALAKAFVARASPAGVALEARTSLHHPHAFNAHRVRRLWAYLTRTKAERTRLRRVLGRDLAKDLDSAYRNGYLCIAIEQDRLEVSLRIHADAWYDGQNLVRRWDTVEGRGALLGLLNELEGFQLRLHDWKGEWLCGSLTPESLEEFLGFYTVGEHQLVVDRRWPAPGGLEGPAGASTGRAAALAPEVPGILLDELERLLPLYRYAIWSKESDHLFGS